MRRAMWQATKPARTARLGILLALLGVLATVIPAVGVAGAAPRGTTERVPGSGGSDSAVSADGRFVTFADEASNLVAGDTNGVGDVFIRDRQSATTERVSLDSAGSQGNGHSLFGSAVSADGGLVAFTSGASNLVLGDTNGAFDVFVRDRQGGTTERVSVDSLGIQGIDGHSFGPAITADGRFVAFTSETSNLVVGDSNLVDDVFVHDRQSGTTERVSVDGAGNQGNGHSGVAASRVGSNIETYGHYVDVSADGRFVAFASEASNLVPGDINGVADVFVHDRQGGTTERVSVDGAGNQGSGNTGSDSLAISADGRFVAFVSDAGDLVAADTNGALDVFVHDRQSGTTERVSVDGTGNQGNSGSGGSPSGGSRGSALGISADGHFVAFTSHASNLVSGDTNGVPDVFVHARQVGSTARVSVDTRGKQANNYSQGAAVSADGRVVAFFSIATNLIKGDTGPGLFVHVN